MATVLETVVTTVVIQASLCPAQHKPAASLMEAGIMDCQPVLVSYNFHLFLY